MKDRHDVFRVLLLSLARQKSSRNFSMLPFIYLIWAEEEEEEEEASFFEIEMMLARKHNRKPETLHTQIIIDVRARARVFRVLPSSKNDELT